MADDRNTQGQTTTSESETHSNLHPTDPGQPGTAEPHAAASAHERTTGLTGGEIGEVPEASEESFPGPRVDAFAAYEASEHSLSHAPEVESLAAEEASEDREDAEAGLLDEASSGPAPALEREPERYDRERLIELLDERMMFERTAFDVYDYAIEALEQEGDPELSRYLDAMRRAQNEEAEHAEWLERLIDQLGGTPGRTVLGRAAETETSGVVRVVERAASPLAVLYAMLASEAVDLAGWRLLLEVARRAGDSAAVPALAARVTREEEHYALVHDALLTATERYAVLRPGGFLAGSGRR